MLLNRRSLIAASAAGFALSASALPVMAATDPRETIRAIGSPKASVRVTEFFSLTCTHCARFTREYFGEIKSKLIDTGKVYWIFWDYPLDQVALTAAMVARSLPPDLYEPFVVALYQSQMSWAFQDGLDPYDGLAKQAALAGMSRETYDKIRKDTALQAWVLQERTDATNKYGIDATPTFRADGPKAKGKQEAGEMSYDGMVAFLQTVGLVV